MNKKIKKHPPVKGYIFANVPFFVPPVLAAIFTFVLYTVLTPFSNFLVNNFSKCMEIGYNRCDSDTWVLAIILASALSSILAIFITKAIMGMLNIKWKNPLWGILIFFGFIALALCNIFFNFQIESSSVFRANPINSTVSLWDLSFALAIVSLLVFSYFNFKSYRKNTK